MQHKKVGAQRTLREERSVDTLNPLPQIYHSKMGLDRHHIWILLSPPRQSIKYEPFDHSNNKIHKLHKLYPH